LPQQSAVSETTGLNHASAPLAGAGADTRVVLALVGSVVVDLFFRIEYIRHRLLSGFTDVDVRAIPLNREDMAEVVSQERSGGGRSVVIFALLRNDAELMLGGNSPPLWAQTTGVLHIDDEKLTVRDN
jgi:hypothetical protein